MREKLLFLSNLKEIRLEDRHEQIKTKLEK